MNVLIFGLGNNGGGLGAARFYAQKGHNVVVSDISGPEKLQKSLRELSEFTIEYDLNGHNPDLFKNADLIIKNPAISPESSLCSLNPTACASDFSIFLPQCSLPVFAITGTKGKSTTAALISHILKKAGYHTYLVGNMGTSPLSFMDEIITLSNDKEKNSIVVAELSSWQLRDVRCYTAGNPSYTVQPEFFRLSVLTSLFPDHMNTYNTFDEYVDDKMTIFRMLEKSTASKAVLPENQFSRYQEISTKIPFLFSNTAISTFPDFTLPENLFHIPAAAACLCWGIDPDVIHAGIADFPGLQHRQEIIIQTNDIMCINDSAATIPEALNSAVERFNGGQIHLIAGGNDKNLSSESYVTSMKKVTSLHLLAGSLTEKIIPLLDKHSIEYTGPHDSMSSAVASAVKSLNLIQKEKKSKKRYILLSPGATSFGLFINEFDRGEQFRIICQKVFKRY